MDRPTATMRQHADRFKALRHAAQRSRPLPEGIDERQEFYAALTAAAADALVTHNFYAARGIPGFGPPAEKWQHVERRVAEVMPGRLPVPELALGLGSETDPVPYINNSIQVCTLLAERAGEGVTDFHPESFEDEILRQLEYAKEASGQPMPMPLLRIVKELRIAFKGERMGDKRISRETVRPQLNRLKDHGLVDQVGTKWRITPAGLRYLATKYA